MYENTSFKNTSPVYVVDVVNALLCIANNKVAFGKVYNLAGDDQISDTKSLDMCEKVAGKKAERIYIKKGTSKELFQHLGVPWLFKKFNCIDVTQIKNDFDFELTPYEKSLKEIHQWLESSPENYNRYNIHLERYATNNYPINPIKKFCIRVCNSLHHRYWRKIFPILNKMF